MMSVELWHFVRAHGVTAGEVAAAILGVLLLALEGWLVPTVWRKPADRRTYGDVLGPVLAIAIGLFLVVASWRLVHKRYLLRPEAGRYTVATVVEQDSWRGNPRFTYVYYVAGQRHQTAQECGTIAGQDLPCPPLHARFYVHFAPESPTAVEMTRRSVPDSIRIIPPLGWAKLP